MHIHRHTSVLVLDDVARSLGARTVLDGVHQSVAPGERIGVIGENGSGKSTLLRIAAGRERPDSGHVRVHAPGGLGYLPQVPDLPSDVAGGGTVGDAVDHALADLRALEREMRRVEAAMAHAGPDALPGLLERYGIATDAFTARDGYDADARAEAAMHGLGLAAIGRARRLDTLSGGERARLGLACLLAAAPELMLLDEPTNHLDAAALDWLEQHLRGHRGTVLVVSHDRVLLERVATAVWVVQDAAVHRHGGGYAGYLQATATARRRVEQEHRDWTDDLARSRELARSAAEHLATGPRHNTDRVNGRHQRSVEKQISARVRQAGERVRRLEENPVPRPPRPMRFTARVRSGDGTGPAADLAGVRVGRRLDVPAFTVAAGERVLVTGPNGAGKSTLLRVLAGDLEPERGTVRRAARTAWLPQESPVSAPDATLLDAAGGDRATLLGTGLFRASDLHVPVGRLSVGQRRRLALARLLDGPVDLLLLDEPTNHLSPALVEDLEEALTHYTGALVAVSHDRRFVERFGGRRLHMPAPREW